MRKVDVLELESKTHLKAINFLMLSNCLVPASLLLYAKLIFPSYCESNNCGSIMTSIF